jgi:FkbM family methyltransferase
MKKPHHSAFIITSSNHGTMIVNRHDHHTVNEKRFGVGHQILSTGSFDPSEVNVVRELLVKRREVYGDGVIALDCGANIGVHTVEWARTMSGWGNVTAFEAQKWIYYALAGNLAINNCFNATAVHAAIGRRDGSIEVPMLDYTTASSFGSLELNASNHNESIGQSVSYEKANTSKTNMVSIDSLNLKRLDFIKLDIEGMELDALAGARKTIAKFKPMMLIEHIKVDLAKLTYWLESNGYKHTFFGVNMLCAHQTDKMKITKRGRQI